MHLLDNMFQTAYPNPKADQSLVCSPQQKATSGLDFELPYNSKLLLLAAYIASRNRPGLERQLFDTGRGKKRRKNALASDRQVLTYACSGQFRYDQYRYQELGCA